MNVHNVVAGWPGAGSQPDAVRQRRARQDVQEPGWVRIFRGDGEGAQRLTAPTLLPPAMARNPAGTARDWCATAADPSRPDFHESKAPGRGLCADDPPVRSPMV